MGLCRHISRGIVQKKYIYVYFCHKKSRGKQISFFISKAGLFFGAYNWWRFYFYYRIVMDPWTRCDLFLGMNERMKPTKYGAIIWNLLKKKTSNASLKNSLLWNSNSMYKPLFVFLVVCWMLRKFKITEKYIHFATWPFYRFAQVP